MSGLPTNPSIIAIDPGTTESALVEWDGAKVSEPAIWPNAMLIERLSDEPLNDGFRNLFIEMVACYGMPVGKEVFETCVWIGRMIQTWKHATGREAKLIYRQQVKLHHCQSARAKDGNIRQALVDKYGEPGTKKAPGLTYGLKSHLWSAFAIATMITEQEKEPGLQ